MATKKSSNSFSKQEAVKYGFEKTKKKLLFFFTLLVIVAFVFLLTQVVHSFGEADGGLLSLFIINIVSWVVNVLIGMGLTRITLDVVDDKKPKLTDLLHTKNFVSYVIGSIVRGLIAFVGFLLLIIPGIIFSIRLQFVTYLIIDRGMGPIDAIKKSWDMTRGQTWNLFLFWLLLLLVNLVGLLLLFVGLFVTIPLSLVATAYVYRRLLGK